MKNDIITLMKKLIVIALFLPLMAQGATIRPTIQEQIDFLMAEVLRLQAQLEIMIRHQNEIAKEVVEIREVAKEEIKEAPKTEVKTEVIIEQPVKPPVIIWQPEKLDFFPVFLYRGLVHRVNY